MKIIWKVDSAPTGPYRSFFHRAWPSALFGTTGRPAGRITSDSNDKDYQGRYLKMVDVGFDLKVHVTIPHEHSWKWVTLKQRVRSIDAAKKLVKAFYDNHPEYLPKT